MTNGNQRKLAPISFQQGLEMKKAINAAAYVECSSKDMESLNEVFEEIADILGKPESGKAKKDRKKVVLKDSNSKNSPTNKCTVL